MKKLMIAAAIVCAAAMSQAANVNWTVKNIYNESGAAKITAANGYSLYLFTTEAATVASWNGITSSADLATAVAKGYQLSFTADGTSDTAAAGTSVQHTEMSPLVLTAGKTYDFYAVAVNGSMDSFYITNLFEGQGISTEASDYATISIGNQSGSTRDKTDAWQSVPEPTSGLLLLLGVAGLALRRRRA